MRDLGPSSLSQVALLRATQLVFESQQRMLLEGTNVPAHIRQRFIATLRLRRDENVYMGWTQDTSDEKTTDLSRDEAQKLEDAGVEEMVARRQAKLSAGEHQGHQ